MPKRFSARGSPADPALDKVEAATFAVLAQALLNLDGCKRCTLR